VAKGEQEAALVDAIEALFRSLMPLLRQYGVSHHELSQALARVFVYDTAEVLRREGRPTTPGRLALLTGLTKGEAEKHLSARDAAISRRAMNSSSMNAPAAVLTLWNSDSRFSTPYGAPLDLALSVSARGRLFEDLVQTAAPGADTDVVLDQLVAAGCAEVGDSGFIRCTSHSYIPTSVSNEQIVRLGNVLTALATTLTKNLLAAEGSERNVERTFQTEFPVSEEGKRALRDRLSRDGAQLLESLDAWFGTNKDEFEATTGHRVGVELFMYDVAEDSWTQPRVVSLTNQ
jgi:hypothetical protein